MKTADLDIPRVRPSHWGSRPIVQQIGVDRVRVIADNGSIPGSTLRVRQGSEISVPVRSDADDEATVHWHGLCLDDKYDGAPCETRDPIAIGGEFTYEVPSLTPACTGTTAARWMAHRHLPIPNESGKMFSFHITEAASAQAPVVERAGTP